MFGEIENGQKYQLSNKSIPALPREISKPQLVAAPAFPEERSAGGVGNGRNNRIVSIIRMSHCLRKTHTACHVGFKLGEPEQLQLQLHLFFTKLLINYFFFLGDSTSKDTSAGVSVSNHRYLKSHLPSRRSLMF